MAQLLPLQKHAAVDYRGLVTDNHIQALYMQKPQLISNVINEIYRVNLGNAMKEFINKFPVKEVEQENGFYTWMLQGQHEKNFSLIRAEDTGGTEISTGNVGGSRERFYLIFDTDFADVNDVLLGEVEDYHYIIMAKESEGSEYKFLVELVTDDINLSVPAEELAGGLRFSKDYNLQPSTLSSRGTKPSFTSPFSMQNRMSMMRMEYEVPGNMINKGSNEPLEFGFKMDGKVEKVWINYQDMVADYQFDQQFARMQLYGKKNWTAANQYLNKDENSKFNIESGSGFFEQIAPGNIHYYNTYDIDWHVEMLVDMGVGKLERGKRAITIGTGEFGAIEIHKQIQSKSSWSTVQNNINILRKTSAGNLGSENTFAFGGQFAEYEYVNGVKLRVEIIPFFDDDIRFKTRHPEGKGLVESHRMIAFDYGGEAGIYRTKPKNADEIWRYIPGLRDPYSPGGRGASGMTASKVDGYTIMKANWGGMMIEDPTKIVDLRYNFVR